MDIDKVFKALADPTRRRLLDLLYRENGQTLVALSEHMDMTDRKSTRLNSSHTIQSRMPSSA